jgi:hypothetical protein
VRLLEDEGIMEHVIASYCVMPLLGEYAPRINPQQLEDGAHRPHRVRPGRAHDSGARQTFAQQPVRGSGKVASCRGAERAKVAARFLQDFFHYHRDLRRLETLNCGAGHGEPGRERSLRELSRSQRHALRIPAAGRASPATEEDTGLAPRGAQGRRARFHAADPHLDGPRTQSRFLLQPEFLRSGKQTSGKYGAQKVFLEGDAIILAILEREGEPELAVSRMCVLAREIIEIVRGYNQLMLRSGMPELELGVGITLQESAPLYLMDGEHQIMISEALNESDRLSSCNKQARKVMESQAGPFHVYVFQSEEPKAPLRIRIPRTPFSATTWAAFV